MITLSDEKVWKKFCYFFRVEKGYSDWTDEQIDYSHNEDDIKEFITWLVEESEKVNTPWKDVEGDSLPEIDKEVIAILDNGKVVFAHRPPEFWDGKDIVTGKVTRYYPKTYDKGRWNIPDVKFWLDVEPPKEIEL